MKVERIQKADLIGFASGLSQRNPAYLPISTLRARALGHHPFADSDCPMLYLLKEGEELVGFQSVLPDRGHEGQFFVWTSGGWVRPDRRRRGYGSQLLQAVQADYQNQVAVANMAPVRQKMLGVRPDYLPMPELELVRYYRRFALSHFLAHRLPAAKVMKPVLKGVDNILNGLRDPFLRWAAAADGPQPEIGERCTSEDSTFLSQYLPWTETDTQYLNWTWAFPWMGTTERDRAEQEVYPFSCYAHSFGRQWCRFRDEAGQIIALLLLQWRDGQVKIPLWVGTDQGISQSTTYVKRWLQSEQIDALTVPKDMAERFQKSGIQKLASKVIPFPFIVHTGFAAAGLPTCVKSYGFYRGDWGLT